MVRRPTRTPAPRSDRGYLPSSRGIDAKEEPPIPRRHPPPIRNLVCFSLDNHHREYEEDGIFVLSVLSVVNLFPFQRDQPDVRLVELLDPARSLAVGPERIGPLGHDRRVN